MKLNQILRVLVTAPFALLASPALAENWVDVGTTGIRVDKDSLRRGSDGLVFFTDNVGRSLNKVGINEDLAFDCQRRLAYVIKFGKGSAATDWRDRSRAVEPNSIEDAELKYVCATAK